MFENLTIWHEISTAKSDQPYSNQLRRTILTNIILLGEGIKDDSVLNKIRNSPRFHIKHIKPKNFRKIKKTKNADFVMCSGKIKVNSDGEYFIEL